MNFRNGFKKFTIISCCILISTTAMATRTYEEEGSINCYNNNNIDEKDTIILFVNGITNSPTEAEESRENLSTYYSTQCPNCEFRKVYNQTDGFFDDSSELKLVGNWQANARRIATKTILSKIATRMDRYINTIQAQKNYDENKVLEIKGYRTTIADLKKQNTAFFSYLFYNQKDLIHKEPYDPKKYGTNFSEGLKRYLSELSTPILKNNKKNDTINAYHEVLLKSFNDINALDNVYYAKYREILTLYYFSNINFYGKDSQSNTAISKSVESLQSTISEYVLSGKKVVVVAHSQGNHIIELAYSKLQKEHLSDPSFMNAIRVVGVASVSSSTPNNAYITWDEDHTVKNFYNITTEGRPLKPNFKSISILSKNWDNKGVDHSFNKIYLSDKTIGTYDLPINVNDYSNYSNDIKSYTKKTTSKKVILELINAARLSAQAVPATITTDSPVTAQLRWEKEYPDMDLHIQEPNNPTMFVNYNNTVGKYGYLDRDDTDYEGPEHYYVNNLNSCEDLANKEWKFYVHQYPQGGHPSVIHLLFKVGNNRTLSRSFGLSNWSSNMLYVGRVKFSNYTSGNKTLEFSMEIDDPTQ